MSIFCFTDKHECCEALAARICTVSRQVLSTQDFFSLVLSGGSTPQYLYRQLASPRWLNKIEWNRAHIFFGDERCVPPDHPHSNYRMAREAMLEGLPIAEHQIHRIRGEDRPETEAVRYQEEIESYFSMMDAQQPSFDLILLGLGSDGHTASLFPGDTALQHTGLVTSVPVPVSMKPAVKRISLTPLGLTSTRMCFLVDGEEKAAIVGAVLENTTSQYPAAMVQRKNSDWFLSAMDCNRFEKYL